MCSGHSCQFPLLLGFSVFWPLCVLVCVEVSLFCVLMCVRVFLVSFVFFVFLGFPFFGRFVCSCVLGFLFFVCSCVFLGFLVFPFFSAALCARVCWGLSCQFPHNSTSWPQPCLPPFHDLRVNFWPKVKSKGCWQATLCPLTFHWSEVSTSVGEERWDLDVKREFSMLKTLRSERRWQT